MGIYNRGTSYYEVINIPKDLIPMFNKKQIWVSLHTQEKTIAKIRSAMILSKVNRQFIIERQKMAIFSDEPDDMLRFKTTLLVCFSIYFFIIFSSVTSH